MIDSIVYLYAEGQEFLPYNYEAFIYDANNNIVEKRHYVTTWNDDRIVLDHIRKYRYSDVLNPFHLIYRQSGNIILYHFEQYLISYNLPNYVEFTYSRGYESREPNSYSLEGEVHGFGLPDRFFYPFEWINASYK